jgi:hyaluronoglucosaminidase
MKPLPTFARRGVVEGFFGPMWSMAHRRRLFDFGARRGMNTYLYAPKDDPYHRELWTRPYPERQWRALAGLIGHAQKHRIDFVYGFHPGKGLSFASDGPVRLLLAKAERFYDAGVRTFAVLFDDIPSRLEHRADAKRYHNSLAWAQGEWLSRIVSRQPTRWADVEWWICPSYYTTDPLLARTFGVFEPEFLENLSANLPTDVACCWTGPSVVSRRITLAHMRQTAELINRRLVLWDNYPVNDLSMRNDLHIGPLEGRDPRLPKAVYAYLNNPLLQEELSFVPLETCFDYAANPQGYDPERSWNRTIRERFGSDAVVHWRVLQRFFRHSETSRKSNRPLRLTGADLTELRCAWDYLNENRRQKWARELKPWRERIKALLKDRGA